VWYPNGGFGHFVSAVLSLHGDNFVRPDNQLNFGINGHAHSLSLSAPKYLHDQNYPEFAFDSEKNYSVLIDNGINNQGKKFLTVFDPCTVIKLCYNDISWPVVAKTSIVKAANLSLDQALPLDSGWHTSEDWAIREKYTLYLRDHTLRSCWSADSSCHNLDILTLLSYDLLSNFLNSVASVSDFSDLHRRWLDVNSQYFYPVQQAINIVDAVQRREQMVIDHIKDIWDQAVINYILELKLGITIPVNDYPNWFRNTGELLQLL
jgi:hypothetical protein